MPNPYRATVEIDGTKFEAISVQVAFTTDSDQAGMPLMGSFKSCICVYADFHDDKNLPFSALQKFFNLANVVDRDKIVPMTITFWKDDSKEDAHCCYKYNGWIEEYKVCNPPVQKAGSDDQLNHMLMLKLQPVMNQQNFQEISFTN